MERDYGQPYLLLVDILLLLSDLRKHKIKTSLYYLTHTFKYSK